MSLRLPATLTVLQGVAILGMWGAFIKGGVFREGIRTVENNQYLGFHVLAETLMGGLLVISGVGMLLRRSSGTASGLVAWGMVIYSTINALSHSVKNDQKLTPILLGALGMGVWVTRILVRAERT